MSFIAFDKAFEIEGGQTLVSSTVFNDVINSDKEILMAFLIKGVRYGKLLLRTYGTFTYTPCLDFTGVDSFTYYVSNGAIASNTATVLINVKPYPNLVMVEPLSFRV